jgi:hypothetical protein
MRRLSLAEKAVFNPKPPLPTLIGMRRYFIVLGAEYPASGYYPVRDGDTMLFIHLRKKGDWRDSFALPR